MHKNIKNLIGCIVTLCLTVIILVRLTELMERKDSERKYSDFFAQEEDFDVLFMGTSHVINGVYPMELWNDYGIVSYNFGGHSSQMATTYWVMENALDYTTPKVVVIDCFACTGQWKCSDIFSFVHQSMDAFPLSTTKIRAVNDLLDDENMDEAIKNGVARPSDEPRTKIGLLWNYSVYHSRWNEIGYRDFELGSNIEKGAEHRIAVSQGNLNRIDKSLTVEGDFVGEDYLRKMIEDCQSRDIEVLLVYLPYPAGEENQRESNYIYDIAEEYGVNYINFLDENVINFQTDLYDKNSHLNPSGARKVTEYLGRYLTEEYGLNDQRVNPNYSSWNEDYKEYTELKDSYIKEQEELIPYLMLLSKDDLNVTISIQNKELFKNESIMSLLQNLGVDTTQLNEETETIIVHNGGEQAEVINNSTEVSNYDGNGLRIEVVRNGEVVDNVEFIYHVDPVTADIVIDAVNR